MASDIARKSKNVMRFPMPDHARETLVDKFVKFFGSPNGRKVSRYLFVGTLIGSSSYYFCHQSLLFDEYRQYILDRSRTDLTPAEVSDDIKERIDAAAALLELKRSKTQTIRSFTVAGFEVKEYGSLYCMQGAWIGVPFNYFYKSTDDIEKSTIQINGKPIDWDSNDGTLLENSLVLTVKEQLFVFCRSLLELDFYKHFYSTSIWAGAMIVARSMAEHNNKKYKMFRKPYYIRYATYPLYVLFAYASYAIVNDFYTFTREKMVDKKLAQMGPGVMESGIDFYTKLINQRLALQGLGGEDEHSRWYGFRRMPIEKRKKFLEEKLAECQRQHIDE